MSIYSLKSIASLTVIIGAIVAPTVSSANVSLKNGNFFVGYTDIIYPGGFEPKIERIYNSKTPFKGMFGWGWGNEYEVYLTVSADGSVVVHEYGGGAENRFNPTAFKEADLNKAVDMIAGVAQKVGLTGSASQMDAYRKRLKTDATFRNDEWEKFRAQGKLQPRQLEMGAQLHSNRFSYEYITKTSGGYVRTFDTGKIEKFDDTGKLQRISDKNGNFIEITYAKDGHPQKLIDNFNRKIFFEFDSQGLLTKLEGENGKSTEYKYNSGGELVYSRDVDGNVYKFKYDTNSRHNLTQIDYADNTSMIMTYYGRDKHEHIKSVKDKDGTLTEYAYETDPADKKHYTASVTVKGSDGKQISSSKYEYFIKLKADGEEWTYKMATVLDGDRTETTYNECCGLPLVIKHGKDETTFEYDTKGHVTKKATPTEVTTLHYDEKAGKVDKVTKYMKANPKKIFWSQFQYDSKANLVFAKNSDGKGAKLLYDTSGRISTLVDQDRHQINFKYNENSKPIEITDPSLGKISVSYTNSGEIKKVESSAGRKIALQVTSAFQSLLEIIRPAGVTLSF
jgi:YD repeat-containing protein